MNTFSVVLTVVVLVAIAVAILLFEKKRAQEIERDLGDMARGSRRKRSDPPAG